MATRSSHNKNNSAVKRILQEARELANDPCTDYTAAPLEDDIFEWHCTIRGPPGTEFEGGLYHCRVLLPSEYPFRPPSVMMLTPNGRFELNKKICISFTSYHEELWQPAWGVRTAIVGLQGFLPVKGESAVGIGSLEYPVAERRRLAALSRDWVCPECGVPNKELLLDPKESSEAVASGAGEIPPLDHLHVHDPTQPHSHAFPQAQARIELVETVPPVVTAPVQIAVLPSTSLQPVLANSQPVERPTLQHSPSAAVTVRRQRMEPLASRPPVVLDGLICLLILVMAYILAKKVGAEKVVMAYIK